MKKKISTIIILFVIGLITLEIFAFIFTKLALFPFSQEPTYSLTYPKGLGVSWRNENMPWGAWHKINYNDFHKLACYDVQYDSNDIGARDEVDYINLKDQDTIILVGDSMIEGVGVDYKLTLPNLIKKKYKKQTINLSAAGDLGPIQYYLLYENYKNFFKHRDVILFFSPYNDFTDNDWNFWKNVDKKRYRPYFKKLEKNKYSYFYPKESIKRPGFAIDLSLSGLPKTILKNYTYSSNIFRLYKYRNFLNKKTHDFTGHKENNGGYYFNNIEAIDGSLYFIEEIFKNSLEGKKISFVIFPLGGDIISFLDGNEYKNLYWYKKIEFLSKKYKINIIDLMHYINPNDYRSYFLECDGHWSVKGHKWAVKSFITSKL